MKANYRSTMLTVKKLRRKPKHFHNFTGLTPEQFDQLLLALEPLYEEAQELDFSHSRCITERIGKERSMKTLGTFTVSVSAGDPRKVSCTHNSLRTSAKTSAKVCWMDEACGTRPPAEPAEKHPLPVSSGHAQTK